VVGSFSIGFDYFTAALGSLEQPTRPSGRSFISCVSLAQPSRIQKQVLWPDVEMTNAQRMSIRETSEQLVHVKLQAE
jgi:hypothetical protein